MSKEAKNIITTVCDEQYTLSDHLLPKHCGPMIAQLVNKKKREKAPKKKEFEKPSHRKTREDRTTMDKLHMALTELCFDINYCAIISVWEAGDTAGKGPGKGPGKGGSRSQAGQRAWR